MRKCLYFTLSIGIAATLTVRTLAAASNDLEAEQIRGMLATLANASMSKDIAALDNIYADDLTYSHSTGKTQTKVELLRDTRSGNPFRDMKFSDIVVNIYGSTAVVSCVSEFLAGQPLHNNHLRILMVFVKRTGKGWQMVARQGTNIAP